MLAPSWGLFLFFAIVFPIGNGHLFPHQEELPVLNGAMNAEGRKLQLSHDIHKRYTNAIQAERRRVDPKFEAPAMAVLESYWANAVKGQQQRKGQSSNSASFTVTKTVFNNHARLLFVAGIEGSGHHAIRDALSPCFGNNLCQAVQFTKDLSHFPDVSHGLYGGFDAPLYNDLLENAFAHMQEMAYRSQHPDIMTIPKATHIPAPYDSGQYFYQNYSRGHLPGLYILGLDTFTLSGMMSFPNGDDAKSKSIDHPDLVTFAMLAEAAGIDLRILVLNRRGHDILYSTFRRGFGHGIEAPILVDNANVLYNQLQHLDPQFYLCLEYEHLSKYMLQDTSGNQLNAIREFLHPNISKPMMQAMWRRLKPKEHMTPTNSKGGAATKESSNAANRATEEKIATNGAAQAAQKPNALDQHNVRHRALREMKPHELEQMIQRNSYSMLRLNMAMDDSRALCRSNLRHIDNFQT
jgi:hypothetical protein